MSLFDDLLNNLPDGTNFPLDLNPDPALSLPDEDTVYLRPPLRIESQNENAAAPIVIISAPGAVGKTALARFLAARKKCHLWDLSKLILGTNTFRGTLARSFHPDHYASLVQHFRTGQVSFVLDAFDEAEIISGWPRIEEFLKDVQTPSVVLLARGETAFFMDAYLEDLAAKSGLEARHVTYGIDYFEKYQAEDFIGRQLQRLGTTSQHQHSVAFGKAVEQIFDLFLEVIGADTKQDHKKVWAQHEVRSFLGYAPVLQAIAKYLFEFGNFVEVQNTLQSNNVFVNGASLVCLLMGELLKREQQKIVNQLRQSNIAGSAGWNGWDNLYTPMEQVERLFFFTQTDKQKAATLVNGNSSHVPDWLIDDYTRALERFLPQHPFLFNKVFTGPAFEDYTFARLIAGKSLAEYVKLLWDRTSSNAKTYVFSPLFAHLYWELAKGKAVGDLAGYLYESATSRASFRHQSRISIFPLENASNGTTHGVMNR